MLAKIGRPTKPPKRGARRVSLGLRVTADVKRQLDAIADKHGRSQSQEAEQRLEQSFAADAAHGGEEMRFLMQLMAGAFGFAGQRLAPGKSPSEYDPETYRECVKAVVQALADAHPGALGDLEDIHLFAESIKGRLATRLVARKGST
jgi:hypothetical protein